LAVAGGRDGSGKWQEDASVLLDDVLAGDFCMFDQRRQSEAFANTREGTMLLENSNLDPITDDESIV
jgi:hypothetical protein